MLYIFNKKEKKSINKMSKLSIDFEIKWKLSFMLVIKSVITVKYEIS